MNGTLTSDVSDIALLEADMDTDTDMDEGVVPAAVPPIGDDGEVLPVEEDEPSEEEEEKEEEEEEDLA